jgi:hypothetical protein
MELLKTSLPQVVVTPGMWSPISVVFSRIGVSSR